MRASRRVMIQPSITDIVSLCCLFSSFVSRKQKGYAKTRFDYTKLIVFSFTKLEYSRNSLFSCAARN